MSVSKQLRSTIVNMWHQHRSSAHAKALEKLKSLQFPKLKRILIVTSNYEIANDIKYRLEDDTNIFTIEPSGLQGINLLNNNSYDNSFDFVICDYEMQNMNSMRFVKELKNRMDIPNKPIIMFSGRRDLVKTELEMSIDFFKEYGITSILISPFSKIDFYKALENSWDLYGVNNSIEHYYTLANEAFIKNNHSLAKKYLLAIYGNNQQSSRCNMNLSHIYKMEKNIKKMKFHLNQALSYDEKNLSVYYSKFQYALEQNDLTTASSIPEQLITDDFPEKIEAIAFFCEFLFKQGRYKELINLINRYHKYINKFDQSIHLLLGKSYLHLNMPDKAEKHLETIVQQTDVSVKVLNLQAIALKRQSKYEQALKTYFRVLREIPDDYRINYNIALLYQILHQIDTAITYTQRSLKSNPLFSKAQKLLANLKEQNPQS